MFFELSSKHASSTFKAHAIELDKTPDPSGKLLRDHDRLIYGDYSGITFPVAFAHVQGIKMRDILDTGWVSLYLISERLKCLLEENNLTGWKTFQIKLFKKNGVEILGYYGFSIIGRAGFFNFNSSEIVHKSRTEHAPLRKYYKGLQITNWDHSDFFLCQGSKFIFVTSQVSDVLKKYKIDNVTLTNIFDIELPEDYVLSSIEKAKHASSNFENIPPQ